MAINVPLDAAADAARAEAGQGWLSVAVAFSWRRPLGAAGAAVVLLMIGVALTATLIAPYDPLTVDFGAMLARPSAQHWLGTDAFGRDVLSRLLYG
ncbi:MAG: ABC transporter permease, partial [candidate division NC10 bacterium]